MSLNARVCSVLIPVFFVVFGFLFFWMGYQVFPATNPKEFTALVGIALTAAGAVTSTVSSFFTLQTQIQAAERLEKIKSELAGELETFKQATSVKSQAYSNVCVASIKCYRVLQRLADGVFDDVKMDAAEQTLLEAEGLMFNLDKTTQEIILKIEQSVFDIVDIAKETKKSTPAWELEQKYQEIWKNHAGRFGGAINELRNRAPFPDIQIPKTA